MRKTKVFSGSSHPELASLIIDKLGVGAAPATVKRFANRETSIEIGTSVRDQDVFIIQSGSSTINDHIMELMIMINACKTSSASRVTAVIPYFPYGKQSKQKKTRGAITAKLIANMLATAGVDHIITMDLHSSVIQGFFDRPVDNLLAEPSIAKYIKEHIPDYTDGVIVAKNAGGAKRVTSLADRLKIGFAMIQKEHQITTGESSEKSTVVGDVKGKVCFIVDDLIDGPGSFLKAANVLAEHEAKRIYIIATHGILSNDSLDIIEQSSAVHKIIVTNTYPITQEKKEKSTKLEVIDISGVLVEAIRRTHNGESISYLFDNAI